MSNSKVTTQTAEEKNTTKEIVKEFSLDTVITKSLQVPGVKVDRNKFLATVFSSTPDIIPDIIEKGPVEAGITRENITNIAKKTILSQTSKSSIASFTAGIPGGIALAATIPADILQFFGMSLRLAQQLSYLYGGDDLWVGENLDEERVKNQLILYYGVMFGVSGAVSGVRVLSSQFAKVTLKRLPQKALTKTFWYPIIKQIGKTIGIKVTKDTVAKGVFKIIPIVGGVISGALNFASMMPMGNKLQNVLDQAVFEYTEKDMNDDIDAIDSIDFEEESELAEIEEDVVEIEESVVEVAEVEEKTSKLSSLKNKVSVGFKKSGEKISGLFSGKKSKTQKSEENEEDVFSKIEKLGKLHDSGIISDEEFEEKKKELLSQI